MTNKDFVMDTMRAYGKQCAQAVQELAPTLDSTALVAQDSYIPDFVATCAHQNMLTRAVGFVCKSSAGRVVRLLQPYDSDIYTAEPEELTAQWGFAWSTDPAKALPFVAISTSPYMVDDCCTEDGSAWRCVVDNTVHAPSVLPSAWEVVAC